MPFDPSAARSPGVPSDNPFYQGAWVCYINGIEVPILGFEVESAVWQIPTFRIHLLPDVLISRLGHEDRVPVQLFYLDAWYDPEKPEFRLLADGEIIGWAYSNAVGARTMSFTCAAHIHLYQQLYFHYMTNVDDIIASRSPDTVAQGFSTPGLIYPYALYHQELLSTASQIEAATPRSGEAATGGNANPDEGAPANATPIQAPYEFVYNPVKGVISASVPNERRAVPMMNFFARHVKKTKLHNRFVRLPILEDPSRLAARVGVFPIFNAARNLEALNAMQRHVASQVGNAGPVWNLVQQTLGLVYMEVGMVPNPCSVLVQLGDTSGGGNPVDGRIIGAPRYDTPLVDQRSTQDAARGISIAPSPAPGTGHELGVSPTTPIRLAQYFAKPQFLFAVPPHCNVIFPSMITAGGWTYDENYIGQPTRIYVNDSVMTQLLRADGPNRESMLHALTVGYPEEADALMHHKVGSSTGGEASGPTESGKNLLIWPEEYFKGPVTARAAVPPWFQFLRQFSNAQAGALTPANRADRAPPLPTPVVTTPGPSTPITALTSVRDAPLVAVPARPDRRGGRQAPVLDAVRPEARPDYPYRWIPPPEVLARGDTQNTVYESTAYREMGGRNQIPPQRGTIAFRDFLYRQFPGTFSRQFLPDSQGRRVINHTIGLSRPTRRVKVYTDPEAKVDDHQAGRALDLTIPKVRRDGVVRANLEVGAPIANWLIENAEAFGIAFITYARTTWSGGAFGGWRNGRPTRASARKLRHFREAPNSEQMDHFDHIHVTLTKESAAGLTGILARGAPAQFGSTAPVTVVSRPVARIAPRGATALPGSQTGVPPTTTSAPPHGDALAPAATNEGDAFAPLFRLYVQQEFLRQRYAQRSGGANLFFHPYLVAGFPAMLFDSMAVRMHVAAYVQSFAHRGSVSSGGASLSTQVQLSYCRTFAEFVADVRADALRFAGRVTAAPAELISEIREVVQDENQAESFYSQLLHGGRPTLSGAAFRWTEAMGYADGPRSAPVEIVGDSVAVVEARLRAAEQALHRLRRERGGARLAALLERGDFAGVEALAGGMGEGADADRRNWDTARAEAADADTPGSEQGQPTPATTAQSASASGLSSQGQTTVTTNLDPNREFAPRENVYADAFASYDVAMRLCARPCCTLDEYIRFWHGGKPVGTLQQVGQVGQVRYDFAYTTENVTDTVTERAGTQGEARVRVGTTTRPTAGFYDRIFKLRPGPGTGEDHLTPPSAEERGYTEPPTVQPSSVTRGVPSDYPETRADWDRVLDEYREKVRQRVRPSP